MNRSKLRPWILFFFVAALTMLGMHHLAHAAADPAPSLAGAADASLSVWTTDGPWWLGIVVVMVALRQFLDRQHRLAQGRLLAGLTGAAGVLVAVVQWHFSGAPVGGILTALLAGFALVQHPTVQPAQKPAGFVRLPLLVALALAGALGVAIASCAPGSAARTAGAAGIVAALDCEAAHLDAAVLADARSLADAKVQQWLSGVKPGDADALKNMVKADLAPIRSDLGRCAVAGALAAATALLQPPSPGTVIQGLAAIGPDPAPTRAAFSIAARELGWPAVKIGGGQVL